MQKKLTFGIVFLSILGILYSWATIIYSGIHRARIENIEELCYILVTSIILSYVGIKRVSQ